jgi:excinuclease ABC subunit C
VEPGDDYAALRQALGRRYRRLQREDGVLPDVLLVDGGKGQLGQAGAVLEELQLGGVTVLAVAKGPSRKAGLETLFVAPEGQQLAPPPDSAALHTIQQIRDEAHRFAIAGHRSRRAKSRTKSALEEIPGIGNKRRQQLLREFGGLQGVARAGVEDLARIKGISRTLAEQIYQSFRGAA